MRDQADMACKLLILLRGPMICLLAGLTTFAWTGCVIPPPIDVEQSDDGPVRLSVSATKPPLTAETLTVQQTKKGSAPNEQEFTIAFYGGGQQSTVRMFIDRNYRSWIAQDSDQKVVWIIISGLCDELVKYITGQHILEVYVSDSGFEDKDPSDLRIITPGGTRDNATWALQCDPAPN